MNRSDQLIGIAFASPDVIESLPATFPGELEDARFDRRQAFANLFVRPL